MKRAKRGNISGRLDTLEQQAPKPSRPSVAVVEAKIQAFIAQHYPDGLPIVDEATLSEEERAERAKVMREIRAELQRRAT